MASKISGKGSVCFCQLMHCLKDSLFVQVHSRRSRITSDSFILNEEKNVFRKESLAHGFLDTQKSSWNLSIFVNLLPDF